MRRTTRMAHLLMAGTALLVLLWLGGCAPIAPAASTVPMPPAPTCLMVMPDGAIADCDDATPPLPPDAQNDACDPIVPFDAEKAGAVAQDAGFPVAWSLGVNFNVSHAGRPLGCLRLYHVAEEETGTPVLEAVDKGGILVDTCTVADAEFRPSRGEAQFCGQGRIDCAINLGQWFANPQVRALVADSPYGLRNAGAGDDVANLTSVNNGAMATYPSLTLVARTRWAPQDDPRCALSGKDQPLFSFTPEGEAAPQHALTLAPGPGEEPYVEFEPACDSLWQPEQSWNTTYATLEQAVGGAKRTYANAIATAAGPQWVSPCFMPAGASVEFWLGPARLTIGADENQSSTGISDGILIDPMDSKPPS